MDFSQQCPRAVCIISAIGAVSIATLLQIQSSGVVTYEVLAFGGEIWLRGIEQNKKILRSFSCKAGSYLDLIMEIEGIMFDLCYSIDAGRQCTSQQQRYHSSDAGTRIAKQ
ncbi:uncharacterized protein [Miscanthus floridulus]